MFDNMERFSNYLLKLELEIKDLSGKHALVTGGNEGIGYFTALHLAKMGCKVTIASRSEQKSTQAVESLKKLSKNDQIDYGVLDLGSFQGVREFAENFSKKYDSLDYCILNAGCSFASYGTTDDGIERTIQINHLGHMQLSLLLLPIIKKAEHPRIIFLSSDLHLDTTINLPNDLRTGTEYFSISQYPKSKLMNMFVVKELSRKLKNSNVLVCAVHPGFVLTQLAYKDSGSSWIGFFMSRAIAVLHMLVARTPEQGAITSAYAVTSDKIISGEYYDSCKIGKYNPQANDTKLVKEVWEESIKLIGIDESQIDYN